MNARPIAALTCPVAFVLPAGVVRSAAKACATPMLPPASQYGCGNGLAQ